ncbi:MAG: Flp pilus assembly complex ATPase component TadA, partial [Betaproteobacteria bacterium]|nr:Flp pilus assembly complex ATPase component TadA [Betaproteobacteria bacterium]
TAEQVFRAAMTGHLVLTTLHTNNAISVIPRLMDMGVLPDIMATNIAGVVAQRLVRRLCSQCKKKKESLTDKEKAVIGHYAPDIENNMDKYKMQEPVGCPSCEHQGYRGRAALVEILRFNDALDEVVSRRGTSKQVREIAEKTGAFVGMAENGVDKILGGETTLDELARVTDITVFLAPPVASE